MAFGDIAETIVGNSEGDTTLTVTYESATPAADDLNALSVFTGATSISSLTAGFTRRQDLTNATNNDEGTVAEQLVTGSGDNTCLVTVSASDEITAIMSLVRGAFQAGVDVVGVSTGPESTDDPQTTGVSGGSTAQASEILVATLAQRNVTDRNPTWARLGTATPTSAPPETGTAATATKRCYQAIQVLTGAGTVGVTASNASGDIDMLGYATFKAAGAPSGRIMSSLVSAGGLVADGGIAGKGGGLAG